ncbi:MAG: AAA family ATPase [Planctomycetes bacterium]|nr:AAA family ATPase [Planctomycetota bacterium]
MTVPATKTTNAEAFDGVRMEGLLEKLTQSKARILTEISKAVIGQEQVINEVLISFFAGSHCLITGVPGLAKTLLIKSIGDILDLSFRRIQFTPDLMPSDITGTEVLEEDKSTHQRALRFRQGPIFGNIILADEINRTPPKTQAALLEAMQEHQVTVAGVTHQLPAPFFVLATQNPIEQEGTYSLPLIQQDRFMFSSIIGHLPREQEVAVIEQTTRSTSPKLERVMAGDELLHYQRVVREVPVVEGLMRYAVRIAASTRPTSKQAPDFIRENVAWGASSRASIYLVLAAKARAVLDGRFHVSAKDIQAVAMPVLRHRVVTNFRAESARITSEDLIRKVLDVVKPPTSGL